MNKKVVQNIYFIFWWARAQPGSASGCFKKATQTPNCQFAMLDIPFAANKSHLVVEIATTIGNLKTSSILLYCHWFYDNCPPE
jgi:hypothetical protein